MLENILKTIQEYSDAIIAIFSVLLVLVTVYYARKTNHLTKTQFKAFLIPKDVSFDNAEPNRWDITLYNLGPGSALNIKVFTIGADMKGVLDKVKSGHYWIFLDWCGAKGPFEIKHGEEKTFILEKPLIDFEKPFFIQWEIQTGQTQKLAWKIERDPEFSVKRLELREKIKFYFKWYYDSFKSLKKIYRLKKQR